MWVIPREPCLSNGFRGILTEKRQTEENSANGTLEVINTAHSSRKEMACHPLRLHYSVRGPFFRRGCAHVLKKIVSEKETEEWDHIGM